jgi:chemosensory pili system protein ChpE/L-lysine exporter family protein LysE/ArgO
MLLFLSALLVGFIFNAAPGAVFAETVRQGLHGGFKPAFAVQVGSLVGDTLWALIGLAGVAYLLSFDGLQWPLGIAGTGYLLWLARDSWRAASHELQMGEMASNRAPRALRAGVLLSVTNPSNLAYFAAIGSAMGALGVSQPTASDYVVFFAGLTCASVAWCFVCAAGVAWVFRRAGLRWARVTYRACAIVFVLLALGTLRDLLWPATEAAATRQRPAAVGKH